jgi:hypothetical protein
LAADIALLNSILISNIEIPQYLLVSSNGGNENSLLLYLRVKGELEKEIKTKGLNLLSIFKPGLLRNRR